MHSPQYLIAARDMLNNAKRNLCYAVSALERTGGDFESSISQIKETIGDLECAVHKFDEVE